MSDGDERFADRVLREWALTASGRRRVARIVRQYGGEDE